MSYYDDYISRVSNYGSSDKEILENKTKELINTKFSSSPSYYKISLNNQNEIDSIILDDADNLDKKKVLSMEIINFGNIFSWNNFTWLITHVDSMGSIYYSATCQKCLSTLVWLDENGIVTETPFTLSTQSNRENGLMDERIITYPDERRYLIIQANEDTNKIRKGKRFIFDDRAWRVVSKNTLNTGLIYLAVDEEIGTSAADNYDLRIANYYGRSANYSISILNGEIFSMRAGKTIQLQTEVKNGESVVNDEVDYSSDNPSIASVSDTGLVTSYANGSVSIKVSLKNDTSIFDTATINVEFDTIHNFTIEIDQTPSILINKSKTFTAIIKDNSVIDPSKSVMWYLYDDDGISSCTVATMTFDSTTQCTIVGNQVGYAKLKAILIGSNPQVVGVFEIKINSVI